MLADLAPWLEPLHRVHALNILCRLAFDSSLLAKSHVLLEFHRAFEALVGNIDERTYEHEVRRSQLYGFH